ncbi:MAG: hypothetical protein ACRD18_10315, partial [Terriglobia bacterium]
MLLVLYNTFVKRFLKRCFRSRKQILRYAQNDRGGAQSGYAVSGPQGQSGSPGTAFVPWAVGLANPVKTHGTQIVPWLPPTKWKAGEQQVASCEAFK